MPADEPVDLRTMVEEIGDELAAQRPGEPAPAIRFEDVGAGPVRSDERKLRRLLSNLIDNAAKYAPGGVIRVRVERDADILEIDVIDGGPGIDAADRDRIFERFVQLDQTSTRTGGGTGLGLYLCRQLAGVLGGTLTLSDADGGGCRFRLTLPSRRPDPATDDGASRQPGPERAHAAATSAGGARR